MTPEHTALAKRLEATAPYITAVDERTKLLRHKAAAAIRALAGEVERLKGDLQLMKLSRDAKLCSECPRIPEWDALKADAERLDFMADNGVGCDRMPMGDTKFDVWRDGVRYTGKTPREAIDAALADKQGET